ncbi:MAG: succinate dehydrogenase assembly factor 2 [Candidatus Symbiobacter sp.]|nr:succinate dehydrogenase assembly factor 2 [Candidatus Symbiobacter sp.]
MGRDGLAPPGDLALRRKRLRYLAEHRGVLELDLILGRFAASQLDKLDEAGLDQFERLLALDESDLLQMTIGQGELTGLSPDLVGLVNWVKST